MADARKKIRPGAIQLHADEAALVVHYEVQEVVAQPDGTQLVTSSSQATKKITVKSLSERTDLAALSADIVDKCKLIHPSKTGLVRELLQQLQQRQLGGGAGMDTAGGGSQPSTSSSSGSHGQHAMSAAAVAAAASAGMSRPQSARAAAAGGGQPQSAASSSSRAGTPQQQQQAAGTQRTRQQPPQQQAFQQQQQQYHLVRASEAFQGYFHQLGGRQQQQQQPGSPAVLGDLEVYLEGLYEEELPQRAAAAARVAQLFRNAGNLQALMARGTLLSTLARLLREDAPRSLDLATSIAACFHAVSCCTNLHRPLLDSQAGSLLMDLAALELQRSAAREATEGPAAAPAAVVAKAAAVVAAAAAAGGGGGSTSRQQRLQEGEVRLLSLVVRQDRFLCLTLSTLANLAEDVTVARKMVKKGVIGLLLGVLGRPHVEVVATAVAFLRRLCVFAEVQARLGGPQSSPSGIGGGSLIPRLLGLLQPGCGEGLACGLLGLLHNLSFDAELRGQMVAGGLVQQAVPLLDGARTAPLAAGLLYQLSSADEAKAAFCFSPGGLSRLMGAVSRALGPSGSADSSSSASSPAVSGGLRCIPELIALAVNVAHSRRVAEWFASGDRLERLLRRALGTGDELAWKLLRNLAVSGGTGLCARFLARAGGMLAMLQSAATGPELFVEVLGTLAAAADACTDASSSSSDDAAAGSSSSSPWALMCDVSPQGLVAFLSACLVPGALEDDGLLECVVLVGALAGWADGDSALADAALLPQLVELLASKRADDEFVLQVCWAFRRCLCQPGTSAALLGHPAAVPFLVDLLGDGCAVVRGVAGACLDAIMDSREDLAGVIRSLRFEAHNQQYLRLAGPDAAALMTAAAGWQQQQQQQVAAGLALDGYSSDSPCWQQQQLQAENNDEAGEQEDERRAAAGRSRRGHRPAQTGSVDDDWAGVDLQQQHQQQSSGPSSCRASGGGAAAAPSDDAAAAAGGRQSMLTTMVLDLDAYVSGAGCGVTAC